MPNDVFISYSRKDAAFALKLTADLAARGIKVWIDQGDIVAGDAWRRQIVEGIEGCRVFLIVLSPNSARSENVIKELSLADSNRKKIIPIIYQPVDIPAEMEYQLAGLQYQSFSQGVYEDHLTRLVSVINAILAAGSASQPATAPAAGPERASSSKLWGIALAGVAALLVIGIALAAGAMSGLLPFTATPAPVPGEPVVAVLPTTPPPTTAVPTTALPPATTEVPTPRPPPATTTVPTTPAPPIITPSRTPTPTATRTRTPTPTRTVTPTPPPQVIPITSAANPSVINPVFQWRQGGSTYSRVNLARSSTAIQITGGPNADSWADKDQMPLLLYSITGDFDVLVKMEFNASTVSTAAGLGVRSASDNLTWVRFVRGTPNSANVGEMAIEQDVHGAWGRALNWTPFTYSNPAYLRIQRRNTSYFTFSYSANGVDWTAQLNNYNLQMPASVQVFMTAFSWHEQTAQAYFSDFRIANR